MAKKTIALIVLVLFAGALIAGIVIKVTDLTKLVGGLEEVDLEGLSTKTTGLEDINLTTLLPLAQIFMGKAIALENIELPKATQQTIAGLNLNLPPGWEIAKDKAGQDKAYQTGNSTVVMAEDKDGNFAIISKSTVANPESFLSNTLNQHSNLLDISGFDINAYTMVMPQGQQAQTIDVQHEDLAIQIRGWVSGSEVYIIILTSQPDDLAVSEQIFGSL